MEPANDETTVDASDEVMMTTTSASTESAAATARAERRQARREAWALRTGRLSLTAPIILDLDGDGVERLSIHRARVRFDMDGDGDKERTSWVGKDDGILFLDRNSDGTISGVGEMNFTPDKTGATSSLGGLAAFDTNSDGKIATGDTQFAKFMVWKDANRNGIADQGEILTLQQADVKAVNLAATPVTERKAWRKSAILNTGTFTRLDGSSDALADVRLSYRNQPAVPAAADALAASAPDHVAELLAELGPGFGGGLFARLMSALGDDFAEGLLDRLDLDDPPSAAKQARLDALQQRASSLIEAAAAFGGDLGIDLLQLGTEGNDSGHGRGWHPSSRFERET